MSTRHTGATPPVAVLTGGSRGIGAAVLRGLRERGHDCLVIGRTPPPSQDGVTFVAHDLADAAGVAAAARDVAAYLDGRPADALINNAGGAMPCATEDLAADRLLSDVTLNLMAPMLLCRAVLPGMRRAGRGSIVNVASTTGRTGVAYLPSYSAAKAGLVAFTQSLAAETAPHGIRVNAVCPGAVDTDLARTGRAALSALHGDEPAAYERGMAGATGLGRLLRPEEVAEVVCWLAAGQDRPVTGQAVNVCGTIEMG